MTWPDTTRSRLRALFRRRELEQDLDDEIRFHIEMQTEANVRRGMSPKEARRQAVLLFGGVEGHREALRDTHRLRLLEDFAGDVRYALRGLRRSPAFTIVALLTLTLGIGANSGLFGLVNALFFRTPSGISDAAPLTRILRTGDSDEVSYLDYREVVEGLRSFEAIAAFWATELDLGSGGEPVRVRGALTSANYFSVLGAKPALGRTFLPEEDRVRGGSPVVVLGHELWERRFGADPAILGRLIVLNGAAFTVVGVTPPGFVGTEFEDPAELWVPVTMYPVLHPRSAERLDDGSFDPFTLIGRLREGMDAHTAEAELGPLSRQIDERSPYRSEPWYEPFALRVEPLRGWYPMTIAQDAIPALAFAWMITGLVLLVACANLANLLLARAVTRRREIGIRLALGVARGRLIRLLLTEALLLALAGGALGLVTSLWVADLFQARLLRDWIASLDVSPDLPTLGFTLALTAATGLLFGLVPALRASRADVNTVMKGDGPIWLRRSRLQGALVIAQIALSLVLLLSGGLFLRKLQEMIRSDLGYDTENVVVLSLDLSGRGYSDAVKSAFYNELRTRAERIPGVESATAPTAVPLGRSVFTTSSYVPSDRPATGTEVWSTSLIVPGTYAAAVGPGFFHTLGIPVLLGRAIDERDVRTGAPVAVVSESLARRFWPGENPLGKTLVQGTRGDTLIEVVGVVGEINSREVGTPSAPHVYTPVGTPNSFTENLLVRTTGDPARIAQAIREEIRRMDPSLPVFNVRTLAAVVDQQVGFQRQLTTVITAFGGLVLLLAALGLYGVIAFTVEGRTREIGVRMALGARGGDVVWVFLRDGVRLTAIGLLIGGALAVAAGVVISAMLAGVRRFDPVVLLGVASILTAVTLVATFLPARRATRVDPMVALRSE